MSTSLIKEFKNRFNNKDIRGVRSPLRICPIGAHSDHQNGRVTGMALEASIDLVYSSTEDGNVNIVTLDFEGEESFNLEDELDYIPGFGGITYEELLVHYKKIMSLQKGLTACSVVLCLLED